MGRDRDPDRTVVLRRRRDWRRTLPLVGACLFVISASAAAVQMWRHSPRVIATPTSEAPPPGIQPVVAHPPPAFAVTLATEAEILADQPTSLTVFRFRDNPAIVVLDFANLDDQARMLNRMAVFEEKDGYPHDRVLDDAELEKAIRGGGDDPATFYYGHDYRASALVRFFAVADRDHVVLTAQEQRLRALMAQLGWTGLDAKGALISLPKLAADSTVDPASRATILRHELSHGEYFTDPAYAAFVLHFWLDVMTPADRAAFHRFLVADHYDGGIEDLMMNESQAYLMHTPDPRFFAASFVGLPQARIDALRQAFIQGMPGGWLHDALLAMPPLAVPARAPRRRRRSRYLGAVSRTRASALRRPPRLWAASIAARNAAR